MKAARRGPPQAGDEQAGGPGAQSVQAQTLRLETLLVLGQRLNRPTLVQFALAIEQAPAATVEALCELQYGDDFSLPVINELRPDVTAPTVVAMPSPPSYLLAGCLPQVAQLLEAGENSDVSSPTGRWHHALMQAWAVRSTAECMALLALTHGHRQPDTAICAAALWRCGLSWSDLQEPGAVRVGKSRRARKAAQRAQAAQHQKGVSARQCWLAARQIHSELELVHLIGVIRRAEERRLGRGHAAS